jgi:hypothetical protein
MRCLACGAEMRLLGVSLADTPMAGFERHSFKCSTCSHISRRLVLSPRPPVANLPLVVQPPEPPATNLQMKRAADGSARAKLAEKLRSRQMAAQDRVAREKTSWAEAVEKLRSKQAALKEQAAVASPSEPAESVGLQQHLQDPQRHLRPPTIPTSPQNAWERALASLRKAKAAAQDPDGAIQEIEVHFRKLFPHDTL